MIETRFKNTEVGKIPEDWDIVELRNYLILLTDYDANGSFADMADNVKTYDGYGYAWYVRATDLEQNTDISKVKYTDLETYKFLKKSSLYGGEVLVAKRGDIGKVYLFQMKTAHATLAPNLYLLKLNDRINPQYLYSFLKYGRGNKLLKGINASTSLGAIYKEDVKSLPIISPTLSEQKRIATALSNIDALISELGKLIEKKQAIKQGAMQQLLTGKKRLKGFTELWVEKKLGDISDIRTGKRNGDEQKDNGLYPFFVRSQTVYRIDTYSYEGEAIIIPGEGGIGKIFHYINGKFDFHQRVYKISDFPVDICVKFIYYYMIHFFGNYALQNTVKATVDSLRLPTFQSFVMTIPPCFREQSAIASVLTSIDNEISALEAKRDKYTAIKQGMMQQLLTGKIRLID